MNDNLPYLDSERHFRLYEDHIKCIVQAWPQIVTFDLKPPVLSPDTLASRLRICIKSLRNHQWTVSWDFAKFIQICDEIVISVSARPGKVVCGPYDIIRKIVPLTSPVESVTTGVITPINIANPNEDVIHAILLLHHHQLLIEPSTITSSIDLQVFNDRYDVSITKDGNVYTIL
jgi:hypothetical protein